MTCLSLGVLGSPSTSRTTMVSVQEGLLRAGSTSNHPALTKVCSVGCCVPLGTCAHTRPPGMRGPCLKPSARHREGHAAAAPPPHPLTANPFPPCRGQGTPCRIVTTEPHESVYLASSFREMRSTHAAAAASKSDCSSSVPSKEDTGSCLISQVGKQAAQTHGRVCS